MAKQQPLRHLLALAAASIMILFALGLTSCDWSTPTEPVSEKVVTAMIEQNVATPDATDQTPPAPPVKETFEIEPQLSLFPRAGDVRPEETEERFPYWKTFIEHIVKTSGPAGIEREGSKICWAIRGIKSIDSVGFFAPLAVQPATPYKVTLQIKTELADGASAGVGMVEFSEFLWIGTQFTEAALREYGTGAQEGIRLTGTRDWGEHSFTFTTGPQTRMIHLILFREGEHDRNPVLFDDISVSPL